MSIGEIARQMGRTPKATESLLTRARDAFREAFALLPGGTRGASAMTQPDSERSIERLIKLAGGRDMPTPEGMERARAGGARILEPHVGAACLAAPRRVEADAGFCHRGGDGRVGRIPVTQRPAPAAPELVARIATLTGERAARRRAETLARVALPVHAGATLSTRKVAWRSLSATRCRCASIAARACASTAVNR